ncbi:hypothetical protein HMPREF9347_02545 [Escherichia coli MS 124-1]|uniref:Uncharacterized protein n=1 Tax=Escherichia coli MS 85-1 TaxID=679202 RepID=A0AAN3MDS3_ECOLX|nr:hypothetical protein HMPREF9347_02545 [Escherichia coli MS 124-1]EFU37399.1 hypothetical protein HMPREF9350_00706 [Escherichia coli MS 85-1]
MPDGATLIRPTNGHNSLQLRSNVGRASAAPPAKFQAFMSI